MEKTLKSLLVLITVMLILGPTLITAGNWETTTYDNRPARIYTYDAGPRWAFWRSWEKRIIVEFLDNGQNYEIFIKADGREVKFPILENGGGGGNGNGSTPGGAVGK